MYYRKFLSLVIVLVLIEKYKNYGILMNMHQIKKNKLLIQLDK